MNQEWSEWNKTVQNQIKKKDTYEAGIQTLLMLRSELLSFVRAWEGDLNKEQFCAMPFMNHKGFENKTVAYSIYHVARIEDIVCNTLISKQEEIFFCKDYQKRMGATLITTGNELKKEQIVEFSKNLDIHELYAYITDVYAKTNCLLKGLPYERLKEKRGEEDKLKIKKLGVVSDDPDAVWLIDYWCGKDIKGLLQMPFSRHWIMHWEACSRIVWKLKK